MPTWRDGYGEARPARSKNPERHHCGIDIRAKEGTPVYATEAGTVRTQGWDGATAKAVLINTDRGTTVLLGAVRPEVATGERVRAGQRVATVGRYPGGGSMLHFEFYEREVSSNKKWPWGQPAPAGLTNPADYLRALQSRRPPPRAPSKRRGGGGILALLLGGVLLLPRSS
jgi:murein DD-endopeptidase MepM/ murein hydrolase activator NlpD